MTQAHARTRQLVDIASHVIRPFQGMLASGRSALRLLRHRSFDTSCEDGRRDERHRRALINAVSAVAGKLAAVAANLLMIPMVLAYLGDERFGVWATVTSFVMLLSFADLGVGNGLMTAVSQASGRGDHLELRRLACAGLTVTGSTGLALIVLIAALYSHVAWAGLLNITSAAAVEVGPSVAVLAVCVAVTMPASVAMRIETGLQRGFVAAVLQIAGAVLSLVLTIVAIRTNAGLPGLVGAMVGAPALASAVNSLVFFGWLRPDLRPDRASFSRPTLVALFRLGMLFFALQVAIAVGMWSDNIIVSRLLGPAAVTQYAIPARLYSLIGAAIAIATAPLWPAYGEALASGDGPWARRTLRRTLKLALIGAAGGALLLSLALQPILNLWVGGKVQVAWALMVGLGLAAVVESWRTAVVMFLNGSSVVGLQLAVDLSFALACVGIRVVLVRAIGLPGIPFGAVLAFGITVLAPYLWYLRAHLFGTQAVTSQTPEGA